MKIVIAVLLVLLVALQIQLWLGGGLSEVRRLEAALGARAVVAHRPHGQS